MIRKLYFLSSFLLFSAVLIAQQDSVKIEKAVLLFYDSTEIAPVVNLIPYNQAGQTVHILEYKNFGSRDLFNFTEEYKVTHVKSVWGGPGVGLVYSVSENRDTLTLGEHRKVKIQNCTFRPTILGEFRMDFKIRDSLNTLLDSTSFFFEVGDTIVSKSNYSSSVGSTGPSFFQDSNLNQIGGFVAGDRFGTLMESRGVPSWHSGRPTSVSFYITSDSSNIGAEIIPKIWSAVLDSTQTSLIIGSEVASSFIPTTIDSSVLGSLLTLPLDNGAAVFSGLNEGKYIVGFESTLSNPNGKSLMVGRDTLGEAVQPSRSSFVYFGHDTNWYAINHLPMINLNFAGGAVIAPIKPCILVGLKGEFESHKEINIFPNPSIGIFTIENFEPNQIFQVYDVSGRLLKPSILNGQLNLSDEPSGIYLLRILNKRGEWDSKKLMKL